jgi:acetyltransferase-like isoleucine patch superfamily enzyme
MLSAFPFTTSERADGRLVASAPMAIPRRPVGRAFLSGYRGLQRGYRKAFSLAGAGAFARFGAHSVIAPPVRLEGEARIAVGTGVFVGPGCWLHVEGEESGVAMEIGDGTSIGAYSTVSAVRSVRFGSRVLTARHVYISDHSHEFGDADAAVRDQGLSRVAPVEIGDGAWLGESVVVLPGVRIGAGAVIGAHSVVANDVPDGAVAVGAPARVVRTRGADGTAPPAE